MSFRVGNRNEVRDRRSGVRRGLRALAFGVCIVMGTTGGVARADGALALELAAGAPPLSTARAPMRVTFKNTGSAELRILDVFEPTQVFFQFSVTRPDGTPITIPGGGKIDPPAGVEQFIAIAPGAAHTREVDMANLLPAGEWVSGEYIVWVNYRNQYGQGCFRGTAESNAITVTIERAE